VVGASVAVDNAGGPGNTRLSGSWPKQGRVSSVHMGDAYLQQIRAGELIADCYRLEEPIGRGAMGAVWRAVHVRLESPVAIKLLNSAIADDPEMLERFLREARSAAAVRSSHVVQIFDYGVDRDVPYIAMELLVGEALDARLDARGVLEPAELDKIFTEVARAVGNAHAQGVVHRDIKPANIFIAREGDVEVTKVLDFGIAKLLDQRLSAPVGSGTHTGNILGTPNYMSPEQARGQRQVDHRSDLWSLAVLAFECLTGKQPFESTSLGDLVVKICTAQPPVPSTIAPVPEAFDAWFLRGLDKDPAQRFRSALEMADELHALLSAEGLGADSRSRSSTDRRFPPDRVDPARAGRRPSSRPREASADDTAVLGGAAPDRAAADGTGLGGTGRAIETEVLHRPAPPQRRRRIIVAAVLVLAGLVLALGPGRALLAGSPAPAEPAQSASSTAASSTAANGTGAGVAVEPSLAGHASANAAPAATAAARQTPSDAPASPGPPAIQAEVPAASAQSTASESASARVAPSLPPTAVGAPAFAARPDSPRPARAKKGAREPVPARKTPEPPGASAPPAPPSAPSDPATPFDPYADRL